MLADDHGTLRLKAHGRAIFMADAEGKIANCWRAGKPYEAPLLEAVHEEFAGRGGLAIDVGANVGNHTLWFAGICGMSVVAFEPLSVDQLRTNVSLNPHIRNQIRVEYVALAAERGEAYHVGKGRLSWRRPNDDEVDNGWPWAKPHRTVRVERLDDYGLDPTLIKIDVEGMETGVLQGGEETIRESRPTILVESWDERASGRLRRILRPWGFERTHVFQSKGVATAIERWDPE